MTYSCGGSEETYAEILMPDIWKGSTSHPMTCEIYSM